MAFPDDSERQMVTLGYRGDPIRDGLLVQRVFQLLLSSGLLTCAGNHIMVEPNPLGNAI